MNNYATRFLGKELTIKIDRPLGSSHPKHGYRYPVNYGYVPNTLAPDGKEVDAYVLGVDKELEGFEGVCIAIIHRFDDEDDKLVVVAKGQDFSNEQIKDATNFQEQYFKIQVIR